VLRLGSGTDETVAAAEPTSVGSDPLGITRLAQLPTPPFRASYRVTLAPPPPSAPWAGPSSFAAVPSATDLPDGEVESCGAPDGQIGGMAGDVRSTREIGQAFAAGGPPDGRS
jgi:hypothetical protein